MQFKEVTENGQKNPEFDFWSRIESDLVQFISFVNWMKSLGITYISLDSISLSLWSIELVIRSVRIWWYIAATAKTSAAFFHFCIDYFPFGITCTVKWPTFLDVIKNASVEWWHNIVWTLHFTSIFELVNRTSAQAHCTQWNRKTDPLRNFCAKIFIKSQQM